MDDETVSNGYLVDARILIIIVQTFFYWKVDFVYYFIELVKDLDNFGILRPQSSEYLCENEIPSTFLNRSFAFESIA